jgi:hypothetical protein
MMCSLLSNGKWILPFFTHHIFHINFYAKQIKNKMLKKLFFFSSPVFFRKDLCNTEIFSIWCDNKFVYKNNASNKIWREKKQTIYWKLLLVPCKRNQKRIKMAYNRAIHWQQNTTVSSILQPNTAMTTVLLYSENKKKDVYPRRNHFFFSQSLKL